MEDNFVSDANASVREWARVARMYTDNDKPRLAGYCDAGISLVNYVAEKYAGGQNLFTAEQILNFFKMTI